ncbi:transposase [Maribrevibacterium harenarium]|uniref:Transposase n=1 Tax=Maribrevibacterium harenarium TaxID=2589817 RepID=A0A501X174_9GAMM|nr:transposase [Maribrevibacterium harenarium]TPE54301.1 transposase [Maribrevibacterium harenarium]
MPRRKRLFLPGVPVHLVQRGVGRQAVFFEDADYKAYGYWMKESAAQYQVDIHAFVLMTNHVHILASAAEGACFSQFMQHIGRHYVPYINKKYERSGTLWEGRFRSSLIKSDRHFLTVMRYIELNPVRAHMVQDPALYRWSSYRHNTGIKPLTFVTPHPLYEALGKDHASRTERYQRLFADALPDDDLNAIRLAMRKGELE